MWRRRDPRPYLERARQRGLRVAFAVDTHVHADFVSGGRELAARGARFLAPARAGLGFPHEGLRDGQEVDLGGLTLRTLGTAGHSPEHLSYLLLDGSRPLAVFTGGALIVGGVARTDLAGGRNTERCARAAYQSAQRLCTLPGELPVYPTHGPGSFCSAGEPGERTSTIGRERSGNPLLAGADEEAFVARLLSGLGHYPAYFDRLPALNREGAPRYGTHRPRLPALTVAHVRRLRDEGGLVVDVRPLEAFAAGHVPGSISNALRPAFATWLGWLADPDRPLIAVLDEDQDRGELVEACLKIGYHNLAGELEGGGMVGLERTVTPLLGSQVFGLASGTAIFSFIVVFGVTKALTNLASGVLAERLTRKTTLVVGWAVALPVPFLLAYGPSWGWIVVANIFLGVNQGLTWSMTVNMKIDLAGPKRRGLATGLNEAAGYSAVGLTALATGYLAARYGLRPAPELLGVAYAALGLVLSAAVIRDTGAHVAQETAGEHGRVRARWVFAQASWHNRTLFGASQAGLTTNLNDGITWAVFPLLYAAQGLNLAQIGAIKAIYPLIWGAGQLLTGYLSDRLGRKPFIVGGMFVQTAAFVVVVLGLPYPLTTGLAGSALLGVGTAMVYPTLIAAASDATHPSWRSMGLGAYRFWRDLGYAVGALAAGVIADTAGLTTAVTAAGLLTGASGVLAWRTIRGNGPYAISGAARW